MHLLCQYASDLPILEDELLAAPPDDVLSAAKDATVFRTQPTPRDDALSAAQGGDGVQDPADVKGIGRRPTQFVGPILMWAVLNFWGVWYWGITGDKYDFGVKRILGEPQYKVFGDKFLALSWRCS
jgi:hypothetical protein